MRAMMMETLAEGAFVDMLLENNVQQRKIDMSQVKARSMLRRNTKALC